MAKEQGKVKIYGQSNVGRKRELNEDSICFLTNEHDDSLILVCDGIGGSAAGEVASAMARDTIKERFEKAPVFTKDWEVDQWIRSVLNKTNDMIFTKSMFSRKNRGMGTTAVGAIITSIGTYVFNVGDSRLYALYDDGLVQMSVDHSLMQALISQHKITEEEAKTHEKRNTLTNALGVWKIFRIDVDKIDDNYKALLACSDGLHGYVDHALIQEVMENPGTLKQKTDRLIGLANEAGGSDNISVVIAVPEV